MKRQLQKQILMLMSIVTGLLVLAAVGAQFVPIQGSDCVIDEPFTCDNVRIDGNKLLVAFSGKAEDVRVALISDVCKPENDFFEEMDGKKEAVFICDEMPPTLFADITIIYGDNERNIASGELRIA